MDEMEYFFEIFEPLPRQGPGSPALTLEALEIARPHLPDAPRVLDIGCGSGAQTLVLAQALPQAKIVALDNHQPFLDRLAKEAEAAGFGDRIEVCNASMLDMPFADQEFDLIWSEGAIYIMGLAGGLKAWKRLLRPNGVLMASDNLWLRRSNKVEVRAFWQEESPEMLDQAATEARIERHGYRVLGHVAMPVEVWEASYYGPLARRLGEMRNNYPGNPVVSDIVDALEYEMDIFRLADGEYSYEYWVLKPTP